MSYLLYLPGVKTGSDDAYARLGLYDLVKDGGPLAAHGAGPDGGHGLLAGWGTIEEPPDLTWREMGQTWKSVGGRQTAVGGEEESPSAYRLPSTAYWLGKSDTKPVEPRTIARATQKRGIWVELADGQRWLVPVARQLPHLWGIDDAGEPCRTPANGYAEFCATSRRVYEAFMAPPKGDSSGDGNSIVFTDADAWRYLCTALALNYHLNPAVVSFLGLIDDASFVRVMAATIEFDLLREVEEQKKTDAPPIPAG